MSSTQDLCDGVATLVAAVHQFESDRSSGEAWQQLRRAVGYMATMVAWKEDLSVAEVLSQGRVAEVLDARWGMDNPDPFA